MFRRDERGELVVDERGRYVPLPHRDVPRGTVPHFHGYRHTAASGSIAAGDGAERVSCQLGHRTARSPRSVYVREIESVERTARRRARMEDRYGALLSGSAVEATDGRKGQQHDEAAEAKVVQLREIRDARQ